MRESHLSHLLFYNRHDLTPLTQKRCAGRANHAPASTKPHEQDILVDTVLKARMLSSPRELDALIRETVDKLARAFHTQDQLLTEKQVAARYGFLDVTKLRNMRHRGNGPKYIKMGAYRNSRVYYRLGDVETWIVSYYQLEPLMEGFTADPTGVAVLR